jgi:hypothetical protein
VTEITINVNYTLYGFVAHYFTQQIPENIPAEMIRHVPAKSKLHNFSIFVIVKEKKAKVKLSLC